jgi:hypothetical protein
MEIITIILVSAITIPILISLVCYLISDKSQKDSRNSLDIFVQNNKAAKVIKDSVRHAAANPENIKCKERDSYCHQIFRKVSEYTIEDYPMFSFEYDYSKDHFLRKTTERFSIRIDGYPYFAKEDPQAGTKERFSEEMVKSIDRAFSSYQSKIKAQEAIEESKKIDKIIMGTISNSGKNDE